MNLTTLATGYVAANWPALIGGFFLAILATGGWKYIPKIVNWIKDFMNQKTLQLSETKLGKNLPNVLITINEVVQDKVLELMEIAEAAKEKAADGKLSSEEIEELHKMVYDGVISQLDDDGMAIANATFKDLKAYIVSKVKGRVNISKKKL